MFDVAPKDVEDKGNQVADVHHNANDGVEGVNGCFACESSSSKMTFQLMGTATSHPTYIGKFVTQKPTSI